MTLLTPTRRGFIGGLAGLIASPAIARASSIMPVKAVPAPIGVYEPWLDELHQIIANRDWLRKEIYDVTGITDILRGYERPFTHVAKMH